jgi:AraC family transcriptional regulator
MAYTRQTIFSSPLLTWQQVTLDDAHPQWSADFRVVAASVLLPLTHCFGCELGGQRFVCDPTSALWLAPDVPYRLRRPWASQRSSLITLTADIAAPGRAALPRTAHTSLLRWQRLLRGGSAEPLQIEEALVLLLRSQWRRERVGTSSIHAAVERAREHIASAPERADTMAEIAAAAHCSPFHLARAFRSHTGHSLHAYRTRLRMGLAVMRIQQGEQNLSGLAGDLGYSSHSHFSSVFRRHFDVTPGQMRRV